MTADEKAIADLVDVLERLYCTSNGNVYPIAIERDKLRPVLREFMNRCRQPE